MTDKDKKIYERLKHDVNKEKDLYEDLVLEQQGGII